ncbi:MAG: hypothetical protein JWM98_73 [Thermoleophilia bacterium]|nr:hypothetical protein [Thermoleophilia bacterium]
MTARATVEEVAALEDAVAVVLSRAAQLHDLANELEDLVDDDVPDELVVEVTRRMVETDRLLTGEVGMRDARRGIPGIEEIIERIVALHEG